MDKEVLELIQQEKLADQKIIDALDKKLFDMRNLIEIGISLSSNLEFESLVESILYSIIGQLFIEKVAILLQIDLDDDRYYIHTVKGYDFDLKDIKPVMNQKSPLVGFLEDNPVPHEVKKLYQMPELIRDLDELKMLEPELIIPMKSKNTLNGMLVLGSKIQGGNFDNDEREFLRNLARFSSTAVENSRLYLMATHDRMTRLYIHHYFQEKLSEEISKSEKHNTPLTIIISDIDHFKKFNDTYGHQQGDIVLKEVAKIMHDTFRKLDLPARYGGEEFAVILPKTDLNTGVKIANRYRKIIEQNEFSGQEGPLHVTVSIGVAEYDPVRDKVKKDLIERADKALYSAKKAGRNKVAAYK